MFPRKKLTVVVYHVQHLAPSNSVCRGTLLVFPGSNVYRGTFLVFPYSNISWGTLLVFPDTNLCSKILLHTILWGKCQKIWENPKFLRKSIKRGIWKSITNPEDLMSVVVYPVQHLASSNSVCRRTSLVFLGSNVNRGTFLVFPYSNFSWGTLLVFPDTNICSKILLHTILWGSDQKFGKTASFWESLKRSGSEKV